MGSIKGLYARRYTGTKIVLMVAGEVVHADVLTLPNGMSKGCGVVEYATASEAQRAIAELSNQTIAGRIVYIREVRTTLAILTDRTANKIKDLLVEEADITTGQNDLIVITVLPGTLATTRSLDRSYTCKTCHTR